MTWPTNEVVQRDRTAYGTAGALINNNNIIIAPMNAKIKVGLLSRVDLQNHALLTRLV